MYAKITKIKFCKNIAKFIDSGRSLWNISSKETKEITEIKSKNAKITLTPREYKYCLNIFLNSLTWYETSKLVKIEFTPFAVKITESIKTEDNNPALGLDFMSSNIFSKKVWVSCGKIFSIKLNKIASKFSMLKNFGMKGIKFKTNKMNGKRAIKKLNETEPALDVSVPLVRPRKYNSIRSKREKPFKPGIFMKEKDLFIFSLNFSIIHFFSKLMYFK